MSEIEELSARLTVLETVVRQLVTHLAVRADNPLDWVQTRKMLALTAVSSMEADDPDPQQRQAARVRDAVQYFFEHVEDLAAEYGLDGARGTNRPPVR